MLLATTVAVAAPPQLQPEKYIYPIGGVSRLYSANFGEIRAGHFHAGIDIKTDGMEGKPLIAIADGYISRVVITTGGYGRAVYLTMPDGKVAVYGHLLRFTDPMESHVAGERRSRGTNLVDLHFDAGKWPVKQGETIGYSGDSGSSGGPHLHFELRDGATEWRYNTIRSGMIRPTDNLAPRIMRIHYIEIDSINGVAVERRLESYEVVQTGNATYRLKSDAPVPAGRRGYFVAEVSDRRDNVLNTFGVWRLTAAVDGVPYFEYRMDGFTYDQARCCDAVGYYPLQTLSRNECIRMAQLTGAPDIFYPVMTDRGIIRTEAGRERRVSVEVEDDCGNISRLEFQIYGRQEEFRATVPDGAVLLRHDKSTTLRIGDRATAYLPAGALYDDMFCRPEMCSEPFEVKDAVPLSPAYRFFGPDTPLRRAMSVTIRADIPERYRFKVLLARRNAKGNVSSLGGSYAGGAVKCSTRSTGEIMVVADTLAPTLRPKFAEGADLSKAGSMRFEAADNFAGISSWSLTVDGERTPSDRYPSRDEIIHFFDRPATGRMHTVEITATDCCGNSAKWRGEFYR